MNTSVPKWHGQQLQPVWLIMTDQAHLELLNKQWRTMTNCGCRLTKTTLEEICGGLRTLNQRYQVHSLWSYLWVGFQQTFLLYIFSSYLCLDHVDPLRSQFTDAVENIHHSFILCHVQHDVHSDEATCPPCTSAAETHGKDSTRLWATRLVLWKLKKMICSKLTSQ